MIVGCCDSVRGCAVGVVFLSGAMLVGCCGSVSACVVDIVFP